MALSKNWRIVKEKEIQTTLKKGFRAESKLLKFRILTNKLEHARILVVISKKIHKKAYFRNLVKRKILAYFEKLKFENKLNKSLDIMIMVTNKEILTQNYWQIIEDIIPTLKFCIMKINKNKLKKEKYHFTKNQKSF